jgi:hypothetical protein
MLGHLAHRLAGPAAHLLDDAPAALDPGVPTRWARFEIHDGWLVAMRVHTDEPLAGVRTVQSASAVRQDRPFEGGTATTIVSRACSTHTTEADQMILSAAESSLHRLLK